MRLLVLTIKFYLLFSLVYIGLAIMAGIQIIQELFENKHKS